MINETTWSKQLVNDFAASMRKRRREQQREYMAGYCHDNAEYMAGLSQKHESVNQETSSAFAVNEYRRWTPGDDEYLMSDSGETVYQKAVNLGRSWRSAKHRRAELHA